MIKTKIINIKNWKVICQLWSQYYSSFLILYIRLENFDQLIIIQIINILELKFLIINGYSIVLKKILLIMLINKFLINEATLHIIFLF